MFADITTIKTASSGGADGKGLPVRVLRLRGVNGLAPLTKEKKRSVNRECAKFCMFATTYQDVTTAVCQGFQHHRLTSLALDTPASRLDTMEY